MEETGNCPGPGGNNRKLETGNCNDCLLQCVQVPMHVGKSGLEKGLVPSLHVLRGQHGQLPRGVRPRYFRLPRPPLRT